LRPGWLPATEGMSCVCGPAHRRSHVAPCT
jgi:hypothetical protein